MVADEFESSKLRQLAHPLYEHDEREQVENGCEWITLLKTASKFTTSITIPQITMPKNLPT